MAIADVLRKLAGRQQTTKPTAADVEAAERAAAQQRLQELAAQRRGRPERSEYHWDGPTVPVDGILLTRGQAAGYQVGRR